MPKKKQGLFRSNTRLVARLKSATGSEPAVALPVGAVLIFPATTVLWQ